MKGHKAKSAKRKGAWGKVWRKPGTSFHKFFPGEVTWDSLSSYSRVVTTRVKCLPGKLSTQGTWGRRGLIKFQTSRLQKESRCWTQITLFVQFRPHQPLVSFREWWELYSLQSPQSCPTLCDPVDCIACQAPLSTGFPGKNIRVGCHARLQGIFLTQGSNLRLLHWQAGFFTTSTTWEALQK